MRTTGENVMSKTFKTLLDQQRHQQTQVQDLQNFLLMQQQTQTQANLFLNDHLIEVISH